MPDGAAVAGVADGLGPDRNARYKEILTSKGRGWSVGRDVGDTILRLGKAVPAQGAVGLTHLALATKDKEQEEAMVGPEVRVHVLVEEAGLVVVFRAEILVLAARAGDRDTR